MLAERLSHKHISGRNLGRVVKTEQRERPNMGRGHGVLQLRLPPARMGRHEPRTTSPDNAAGCRVYRGCELSKSELDYRSEPGSGEVAYARSGRFLFL